MTCILRFLVKRKVRFDGVLVLFRRFFNRRCWGLSRFHLLYRALFAVFSPVFLSGFQVNGAPAIVQIQCFETTTLQHSATTWGWAGYSMFFVPC